MKELRIKIAGILLLVLLVPAYARAQQQAKTSVEPITHLRLDILLSEYDGSKEVSSLPYTLFLDAATERVNAPGRSLRMGLRVPIVTSSGTNQQFQYEDIGTDIDVQAKTLSDGSYNLDMSVNRSSVYSANQGTDQAAKVPQTGSWPVVRTFRSSFDLGLRDEQTAQGPSATDPFNGHVLKISVTLHVIK